MITTPGLLSEHVSRFGKETRRIGVVVVVVVVEVVVILNFFPYYCCRLILVVTVYVLYISWMASKFALFGSQSQRNAQTFI